MKRDIEPGIDTDFIKKCAKAYREKRYFDLPNRNKFLGLKVSKKNVVTLFYYLTRGQRYSTHLAAARKKFYQVHRNYFFFSVDEERLISGVIVAYRYKS